MATKQDVRDAVAELARITNGGFEEVYRPFDVRELVEQHTEQIEEIRRALNLV